MRFPFLQRAHMVTAAVPAQLIAAGRRAPTPVAVAAGGGRKALAHVASVATGLQARTVGTVVGNPPNGAGRGAGRAQRAKLHHDDAPGTPRRPCRSANDRPVAEV